MPTGHRDLQIGAPRAIKGGVAPRANNTPKIYAEIVEAAQGYAAAGLSRDRDVTLAGFAKLSDYSPRQVQRILEPYGGLRQMRRAARMDRATELLLRGQRVSDVAGKVGYSVKHFAKPFADYTGKRPQEVREIGRLVIELRRYAGDPPRMTNEILVCRVVDRWTYRWRTARQLQGEVNAGTVLATRLAEVVRDCIPIARPLPRPDGRLQRQHAAQRAMRQLAEGPIDLDAMLYAATERAVPTGARATNSPTGKARKRASGPPEQFGDRPYQSGRGAA